MIFSVIVRSLLEKQVLSFLHDWFTKKENKEVNIVDTNRNNSYKTKKKFTGSCTEVNPKFCCWQQLHSNTLESHSSKSTEWIKAINIFVESFIKAQDSENFVPLFLQTEFRNSGVKLT